MKKRRINRGLALAALLLAAVVAYECVSGYQFSKYRSDIKQFVSEYIDDVWEMNLSISSAETNAQAKTQYAELINKYWKNDSAVFSSHYYTKEYTEKEFDYYEAVDDISKLLEYSTKLSNMSVKKYGPGYAMVTFDLDVNVTFVGTPIYYTAVFGLDSLYSDEYDYFDHDDTAAYNRSVSFSENSLILRLEDGQWSIVASDTGGWYETEATVVYFDESSASDDSSSDESVSEEASSVSQDVSSDNASEQAGDTDEADLADETESSEEGDLND